MKKSLTYLPKHKRSELKLIVEKIHELVKEAEMIILYGSYARGVTANPAMYQITTS
ncbi:MAG: nucleotidyltransferase domain-containing protein [Planctomycetota bacterium]|jgi:hypothetical protein